MKVRFRHFPDDFSRAWWLRLLQIATGDNNSPRVIDDPSVRVDVSICGPYYGDSDDFVTPANRRLARALISKTTKGQHLLNKSLATGINPDNRAKVNLWYTGENERPPYGDWDGIFSFETEKIGPNFVYLPLWVLLCTKAIGHSNETIWGNQPQSFEVLCDSRKIVTKPKKFACAFIGKAYSSRLYLIDSVSKIGTVDIFGNSSRRIVSRPTEIAKNYRFCVCLENDVYPGYVTEKPFEAYLSGCIPIYRGLDKAGYLNEKAIVNLLDHDSVEEWIEKISKLEKDSDEFERVFQEPILKKPFSLEESIGLIRNVVFSSS